MAATIRDIALHTGLSLGTISNFLNGVTIKEKNQRLIEQAIHDLDYQFNQTASALKSKKSRIIGLIIPSLDLTFSLRLLVAIEHAFSEHNYMVSVCVIRGKNLEQDQQKFNMLMQQNVDGLIIVPPANNRALEKWLLKIADKIPLVILDRILPKISVEKQMTVDNLAISREATEGVIAKGHQNIAIILGDKDGYTTTERLNGYLEALRKHDLKVSEEFIRYGDFTYDGGYQAMSQLMTLKHKPTAIFITNYDMTLGSVEYINQDNLKVAEDISIIGFDLNEINKLFSPNLAMVIQPLEEMARYASQVLLHSIRDQEAIYLTETFFCKIDWGESIKQIN